MIRWLLLALAVLALGWGVRWLWRRWRRGLHGKALTGRIAEYHDNGRMKAEYHVVDGMLHGPWLRWDEQGNKLAEGAYERGAVHGVEVEYGPGGVKASETPWAQGRRHGTATVYDEAGRPARQLCYLQDTPDQPAHDGPCSEDELAR